MTKLLSSRNTVVLVSVIFLWRLYLSATLQLHPDEAYYWLWSRHLDISYFDHPPMVAYFIWLGTLVSRSEMWVRLSGALVMLLLSRLMWQLSMQLFKSVPVAAGSVILFNLYPLTMLGMVVITPDVPVLLFWSLGVYLFWQIMRSGQAWRWYPLGLCFGMALLSKYTAILMPACFLLYLLISEDRRWLTTIHPYLAILLGLACFLPVVFWNSRNDWVSFFFQFKHGLGGEHFKLSRVAEYMAGQLVVVGPVVWILGMVSTLSAFKQRDKETLLLICSAVPVILFFGLSSMKKVAGANWPAFAYFTFSMLVAKYCLSSSSTWRRSLWAVAFAVTLTLSLIATLQARFGLLSLGNYSPELAAADATNAFHGWRELGDSLKKYSPQSIAIAPSHQLAAEIIYYTDENLPTSTTKASRPSQFNLLDTPDHTRAKERIFVWTNDDLPDFDGAQSLAISMLKTYRDGNEVRTFHIASGPNRMDSLPLALAK